MLDCSLEIAEVLPGEEGDDGDRKLVCTYFGKQYRQTDTQTHKQRETKIQTDLMIVACCAHSVLEKSENCSAQLLNNFFNDTESELGAIYPQAQHKD